MNVVYPLTAQIDYTELKYSLRSIEKFLDGDFEIVIVGNNMPDWITNVTQIELPDILGRKQLSIRRKILAALEYSEEIIFMNDDVFLLQKCTGYPYFWHGMLKKYSESGARPLEKELENQGKPTKHFDGHYPLIYRQDFKEVSKYFSDNCIIKSMYCNYMGIEGEFVADCKLLKPAKPAEIINFIKDKPCFSTSVYSLNSALPVLNQLFPYSSNFEI